MLQYLTVLANVTTNVAGEDIEVVAETTTAFTRNGDRGRWSDRPVSMDTIPAGSKYLGYWIEIDGKPRVYDVGTQEYTSAQEIMSSSLQSLIDKVSNQPYIELLEGENKRLTNELEVANARVVTPIIQNNIELSVVKVILAVSSFWFLLVVLTILLLR